ncbi:MAG: hypothetical protein LUI14_10145 [Lachnospiraceae bacterium]|nr:hypothetical protein [Lachnospiraceae bacterium]
MLENLAKICLPSACVCLRQCTDSSNGKALDFKRIINGQIAEIKRENACFIVNDKIFAIHYNDAHRRAWNGCFAASCLAQSKTTYVVYYKKQFRKAGSVLPKKCGKRQKAMVK